jgi:hypothetical protein
MYRFFICELAWCVQVVEALTRLMQMTIGTSTLSQVKCLSKLKSVFFFFLYVSHFVDVLFRSKTGNCC